MKNFVIQQLINSRGDDLERATAAFRGWPDYLMDAPYGLSNKTPRQMLAEYKSERDKFNAAIEWVKAQP